jgi:hypothetical protein
MEWHASGSSAAAWAAGVPGGSGHADTQPEADLVSTAQHIDWAVARQLLQQLYKWWPAAVTAFVSGACMLRRVCV